jgi:alkanesulfonate monooxygenase SsuD/methylene tetrahydromethanopterin reductase-like flavin-dependent oxidoreductase (luciferase family)
MRTVGRSTEDDQTGRESGGARMNKIAVGCSAPSQMWSLDDPRAANLDDARADLRMMADAGLDHVAVIDHVSFRGGRGTDGLITAALYAALEPRLTIQLSVYLLSLRHPTLVARELMTLASYAPGRLVFGVGVGGDDRHEVEVCGVDPSTRGRRMDESLEVLHGLLTGEPVTYHGRHFSMEEGQIVPAPSAKIPIIVGGRSDAAIRRAGRLGEGWHGVWCSPSRFAAGTALVDEEAERVGRGPVVWRHGLQVWCGIGASREDGRRHLEATTQRMMRLPFHPFERYAVYGTPADVAEALYPFVEAGCRCFSLMPCAADGAAAIAGAGEVRHLLNKDHTLT